jgi:transcriptional regulator of acetoin/glycerol metabolism
LTHINPVGLPHGKILAGRQRMRAQSPAQHAASVEAAIGSGQAARSSLVASWHRSSRLHGLEPALSRSPLRLTDAELGIARERAGLVVPVAKAAMSQLFQAVGAAGCCVLLAGRDGVPLERRGAAGDDATFEAWGLWTGSLWSEEHEGTNGIGTALTERRALTIDRDQHFLSRNMLMSCTAAPIYDQDAELAGVLDVSTCRADRADPFAGLIAMAVSETVRAIEAEMFRTSFARARIVLVPAGKRGAGGLIAVDADDLVIGATRSARAALGLPLDRKLKPVPAADLLGESQSKGDDFAGLERSMLQRALLRSDGNVSAAARALGVSRATLHRKLSRCEIRTH